MPAKDIARTLAIQDISPGPLTSPARLATQSLFRQYADFLRATQACGGAFNFTRFEEEIETLPAFYSNHNGAVLLALIDENPAACIAYRDTLAHPASVEIKRLFVSPDFRGRGLARTLITEVLARAITHGFTRAILDTDTASMPEALALYASLGFREFGARQGTIAFFERSIL